MHVFDHLGHRARLLDDVAQVAAGAHFAAAEGQGGFVEPGVDQVVLEGALILEVSLRLALGHFVERRLRDVEMTLFDQLGHLAVEERQEQGADMRTVDVCVRHDDDLVIAQLAQVKIVAADTGPERGDEGTDLLTGQHFVESRPFHVQDLATQWQYGLELAVAALLGGAAGQSRLRR